MFPRNKKFTHVKCGFEIVELESVTTPSGTRKYKTPDGDWYVSVTTALKHLSAEGIAKWKKKVGAEEAAKVSKKASSRGGAIHEMCEHYLNNLPEKLQEESYAFHNVTFSQIKSYLNRIDNITGIELPLYSKRYKLAGRTDCIAEYDGVLSVIDFKTSLKLKKKEWIEGYFLQATAYALMFEERTGIKIDQLVILISTDAGEAQEFIEYTDNYKNKLMDALVKFHKLEEQDAAYM